MKCGIDSIARMQLASVPDTQSTSAAVCGCRSISRRATTLSVTSVRALASLGISPREMDILTELAAGHSNKEIAAKLNVSPNTVKSHISAIFRALNATNRTQAVIAAQSGGFRVGYEKSASGARGPGPSHS